MTSTSQVRDRVLDLYTLRGAREYEGEGVTHIEHAAQCAALACAAGAPPRLQLAAWLHDIGHLLSDLSGTPTIAGIDDHHEVRGAAFLSAAFGPDVAHPVALHVAAKRYLVAVNPEYRRRLSEDSCRSLVLQGGPMSIDERETFTKHSYSSDALRLRAWDDAAKRPVRCAEALAELQALLEKVQETAHVALC